MNEAKLKEQISRCPHLLVGCIDEAGVDPPPFVKGLYRQWFNRGYLQGKQAWWLKEWVIRNWSRISHEKVTPVMPKGKPRRTIMGPPPKLAKAYATPLPDDVSKGLYPYQKKGVQFIEAHGGRALLADDMGLGKTIQAARWLKWSKAWPAVIVSPSSVKYNWQEELAKWARADSQVLEGKRPKHLSIRVRAVVINYDILREWNDTLRGFCPRTVIVDEAHYIKNRKAKRTKAVQRLCKRADHVIALTGTPIESRPNEIFTVANLVRPGLFPYYQPFSKEFCDRKFTRHGWDDSGVSNPKKLHDILVSTVMLRRLKKDVLKDLPAKTVTVLPVEINNRPEYDKAQTNLSAWLKEHGGHILKKQVEAMAKIEYLKQITTKGKMSAALEWIEDFMEDSDDKLVVFATHRFVVELLCQRWPTASRVEGGVDAAGKRREVRRFTEDRNTRLLVGNLKAAGVGLNLQVASTALFLELGWTPAAHTQAIDRLHRIGQRKPVSAYYLIGRNTVEEPIIDLLDAKLGTVASILDGGRVEEAPLLRKLLESLKTWKDRA